MKKTHSTYCELTPGDPCNCGLELPLLEVVKRLRDTCNDSLASGYVTDITTVYARELLYKIEELNK